MSIKLPIRAHLTWWQKTVFLAVSIVACGVVMSVALIGVSLDSEPPRTVLTWAAFTAFPLAIVVLLAIAARQQERIDLRAGQQPDGSNRARL